MKKVAKTLLFKLLISLLPFCGYAQRPGSGHLNYDTLRTESHIAGLNIAILHEGPKGSSHDYPVLFLHGSVIPVNVSFGFRMNNYSWMDNLAENGYDVYALDFLGYGNSDRYPEMRTNSFAGKLPGRVTDVYWDVDKAVDLICKRTGKNKVYLIGHSWGGVVAALYASQFKDKIGKLVLYAPYTVKDDPKKPVVIQRSYATMTPTQRIETFRNLTPAGKECRMEPEMFDKFIKAWQPSDPLHALFNDDSVRFPSGPEQDTGDLLHGQSFYDPRNIRVPVLLVRGEWDRTPGGSDADMLYTALENAPYKKYVVIEKATHILHLEKSRYELYDEVLHFLKDGEDTPGLAKKKEGL